MRLDPAMVEKRPHPAARLTLQGRPTSLPAWTVVRRWTGVRSWCWSRVVSLPRRSPPRRSAYCVWSVSRWRSTREMSTTSRSTERRFTRPSTNPRARAHSLPFSTCTAERGSARTSVETSTHSWIKRSPRWEWWSWPSIFARVRSTAIPTGCRRPAQFPAAVRPALRGLAGVRASGERRRCRLRHPRHPIPDPLARRTFNQQAGNATVVGSFDIYFSPAGVLETCLQRLLPTRTENVAGGREGENDRLHRQRGEQCSGIVWMGWIRKCSRVN